MNTRHSFILLILLAACNPEDPEDDGIADPVEAGDEGQRAPPELPCGDANLWTDDLNCGACGNECEIMWPGTEYESGHCVEGKCGPIWSPMYGFNPVFSNLQCAGLCAPATCAPLGCAGKSALVCLEGADDPHNNCDLADPYNYAYMELTIGCGQEFPDPAEFDPNQFDPEADMFAMCCCEQP